METEGLLSLITLALSMVCFTAASLIETSIATIRRERVQQLVSQDVKRYAALERLHNLQLKPARAVTLLRLMTMSACLISSVALVIAYMGTDWTTISLASLGLLGLLGVIHNIAGAIPSTYREGIAQRTSNSVRLLSWLIGPILTPGRMIFWASQNDASNHNDSGPEMVPTEIDLPVEAVAGPLDEREVRMIHGVVRLDSTPAREIMVPRPDIIAAEIGTRISELSELMVRGGHSRIPVYRGDLDHVEGVAYARDILQALVHNGESSAVLVDTLIRPALFIPEGKTLEDLLNEFQNKRVHVAIVVDEYGGVSGLVTIEDLLEEIVGEIRDEFELGEPEIQELSRGQFNIDARLSIEQLNDLLNVGVQTDGFDTIGGFVYQRLGKIPSPGDIIDYAGIRVEVVSTVGRRLKRLRVTRSVPSN